MTAAHTQYLNSIKTATKEKPFALGCDFLDTVQEEDPKLFRLIQQEIKDKNCVVIPAGFELTQVQT